MNCFQSKKHQALNNQNSAKTSGEEPCRSSLSDAKSQLLTPKSGVCSKPEKISCTFLHLSSLEAIQSLECISGALTASSLSRRKKYADPARIGAAYSICIAVGDLRGASESRVLTGNETGDGF
jgi:hypothetical protein